jgi:hypothetical protein
MANSERELRLSMLNSERLYHNKMTLPFCIPGQYSQFKWKRRSEKLTLPLLRSRAVL